MLRRSVLRRLTGRVLGVDALTPGSLGDRPKGEYFCCRRIFMGFGMLPFMSAGRAISISKCICVRVVG